MIMMWLWLVQFGFADALIVRVAVDDRQGSRLQEPVVLIEGFETPLLDNGALPGDVAGDGIYVGQANIQHQESISLVIQNGDGSLVGTVAVSVPKDASATFQLKTNEKGIVLDINAPNMPVVSAEQSTDGAPSLLIQGLERVADSVPDGQSEIRFTLDATERAVIKPMLTIDDRPEWAMLVDDGSIAGDLPKDGVYTGLVTLPSKESLGFQVSDDGSVLGNLEASLPSAQGVLVQLKYSQYGLAGVNSEVEGQTGSMVVQATPKGESVASNSGSDKIALIIHLDDRLLQRLQTPTVTFVSQKSAAVNFRDDGINGDSESKDAVWMASTVLERDEFVQLKVIDGDQEQGQLTVFLPSTSEAEVWLRSTESGIKLVTEPTQSGTTTSSSTIEKSGGTNVTSDRLAHVLWVMITLFAIGFAYVRKVIQERWSTDIHPAISKINQYMENQGERDESKDA